VAAYFGAALILIPMAWLMELVNNSMGSTGTLGLSVFYGAIFALFAEILASKPDQRIASGLLYVLAVSMTPFAVGSLMQLASTRHFNDQALLILSVTTVVTGVVATLRSRISFVSLPAWVAALVAFDTAANLMMHANWYDNYTSMLLSYGAIACVIGFVIDRRSTEDYAYWAYNVGAIAIWFALSETSKTEPQFAAYAGAGLLSMFLSVVLSRRIFAITGGAAVIYYVLHVMYTFFGDSIAFPLVLTLIGGLVIYLGVFYSRNHKQVDEAARRFVPKGIRRGLPRHDDK
jgi:hypothetical protein